nr:AEC family transporter [Kineosphaera limosa]
MSVTFPFFALIGIGYLAARTGALPVAAVPGLNVFVLYFALTAMLYQLGAATPIRQLLDPAVLGLWLVAGLAVLAIAAATARRSGRGWLDSAFGGLIAALPNSGFMGVPLLLALVGQEAAGPISASLLVDIVLIQSIAIALAHFGDRGSSSLTTQVIASLGRVVRNPLPWAIMLGALAGWAQVSLPAPVDAVVTMLAAAATPVALFTIGAVLARERGGSTPGRVRTGVRAFGDAYWLAGLKLFVHPLLVWVLGLGMQAVGIALSPTAHLVLILTAALPAAANVAVLAERYGANSARVARVILISTVLSYLTFTAAAALSS